jgi:DNA-binding NarL/FixJ family response regulator
VIRVAVAAQALALRAGLRLLLSTSETVEVVAEAASLPELEPLLSEIDVLVLAAPRPPDGLGRLPAEEAPPAVLLLTDDVKAAAGLAGLRREAARPWGILPLEASAEELLAAVTALHEGLIVVSPSLAGEAIERLVGLGEVETLARALAEAHAEALTERERQVLQLLAQGLANKQIAASLSISEHTVKFHVSGIYAKLGAASRTEAVRLGVQQGLVVL